MSRLLYLIACGVLAIGITFYGGRVFERKPPEITAEYSRRQPLIALNPDTIMGKAAYAENTTDHQMIIGVNSELQFPLASVTKVMTALLALEELSPETVIKITPAALAEDGESGLLLGEQWSRDDLVSFMLVASSNDAARALAQEVIVKEGRDFAKIMNERAQELGLVQTFYYNPTGLDMGTRLAGAYGSAHDQAILLNYAQEKYPDIFVKTTQANATFRTDFGTHMAVNTNSATGEFSGLRASKTGYTDLAGGNLALIYDLLPGKKIASVILGSTEIARFIDSKTLLEAIK